MQKPELRCQVLFLLGQKGPVLTEPGICGAGKFPAGGLDKQGGSGGLVGGDGSVCDLLNGGSDCCAEVVKCLQPGTFGRQLGVVAELACEVGDVAVVVEGSDEEPDHVVR